MRHPGHQLLVSIWGRIPSTAAATTHPAATAIALAAAGTTAAASTTTAAAADATAVFSYSCFSCY